MLGSINTTVGLVLAGLAFPAQRSEILMFAEHYGADWYTRQHLAGLAEARYPDLAAVTTALAHRPRRAWPRTARAARSLGLD